MRERIIELMGALGMTATRFATTIGVRASNMSHILSGRNNPSLDFAISVLAAFPNVCTDWLILGTGSMFRDGESPVSVNTGNMPELFEQPIIQQPQLTAEPLKSESIIQAEITPLAEANKKVDTNTSINPLDNILQNSDIEQVMVLYKDRRVVVYKMG